MTMVMMTPINIVLPCLAVVADAENLLMTVIMMIRTRKLTLQYSIWICAVRQAKLHQTREQSYRRAVAQARRQV